MYVQTCVCMHVCVCVHARACACASWPLLGNYLCAWPSNGHYLDTYAYGEVMVGSFSSNCRQWSSNGLYLGITYAYGEVMVGIAQG
jgi:hypothetical protein